MHDDDRNQNSIPELAKLHAALTTSFGRAELDAGAPSDWRSRRRRIAAVSAAVAAISVASAIAISGGGGAGDSLSPITTKQALAEVAKSSLAVARPNRDEFLFARSEYSYMMGGGRGRDERGRRLGSYRAIIDVEAELWTSATRCGLSRQRVAGRRFPTERDRVNAERAEAFGRRMQARAEARRRARGQKPLRENSMSRFGEPGSSMVSQVPPTGTNQLRIGRESLSADELREYPTQPAEIFRRVRHRSMRNYAGPRDAGMWFQIMSTLMDPSNGLTPEQRAGFVNAISFIPGVISIGDERDPRGRSGIGFAVDDGGLRSHVIFERASGVPVYSEQKVIEGKARRFLRRLPIGTVIHKDLQVERSIADRLPDGVRPTVKLGGVLRCER